MNEAYSLAESMEAMTHEHITYRDHFVGLVQDLDEAKRRFLIKHEVGRAQLMTEALAGMLTIRTMFEDIQLHRLIPKTADDPVMATLHFEDRVTQTIKFFASELQSYALELTNSSALRHTHCKVDPVAGVEAVNQSDEEIARQMQEVDDADYARRLDRRVYYCRPGTPAGVPPPGIPASAADEQLDAFLDNIA